MGKSNNGNITIANFIALVGMAGIGVVTFFGLLFHSQDGTPGGAIIGAVALMAGLTFLLVMSIKAKSCEDNPDKWRFVEWACLIAYIVVAAFFATPFQRFFYTLTEKENMKALAKEEVKAIETMYQNFEYQQKKFLVEAVEQIQNYRDSHQIASAGSELAEYVKNVGNLESWQEKAELVVKLPEDKELAEIKDKIEVWNLMSLAALASDLDNKGKAAWRAVEKHIQNFTETNKLIPVIGGGGIYPYSFDGYAKFNLGSAPEAKFAKTLRSVEGHTALGWIIYIFLNLMVLLNYLVTNRTNYVAPSKRKTPGTEL